MTESAKESVSERLATPDEQKGMDWWNAITEPQRSFWLKRAASAVPADAWRAYCAERDIADIVSREPRRMFSGVEIYGFEFSLRVYPRIDGLMSVQVIAEPPATGFDSPCTVSGDGLGSLGFEATDAKIGADTIEWFAPGRYAARFREGFRIVVEPHQCQQLRAWLPRLAQTAVMSRTVADAVTLKMGNREPHYLGDFVTQIVARIVLDGEPAAAALAAQCAEHWAGKEEGFKAALHSEAVQSLLAAEHGDFHAARTR